MLEIGDNEKVNMIRRREYSAAILIMVTREGYIIRRRGVMEDIMQMARIAAEVGARSAIEKYEAQQKRAKSERRDKRLRNTRLLLQNYRNFKACIEHSVFDIEQMQETSAAELLDLMWEGHGSLQVDSIKQSTAKTAVIVAHIDTMVDLYEIYCERSPRAEDKRRCRIIKELYISKDAPDTVENLARREDITVRTVYKDIDAAIEKISVLIFGIDGVIE